MNHSRCELVTPVNTLTYY